MDFLNSFPEGFLQISKSFAKHLFDKKPQKPLVLQYDSHITESLKHLPSLTTVFTHILIYRCHAPYRRVFANTLLVMSRYYLHQGGIKFMTICLLARLRKYYYLDLYEKFRRRALV